MSRQAGFTLLELMIVLAIMGLMLALAFPLFPKLYASAQLNATANELIRDLRDARSSAIGAGHPVGLTVDDTATGYVVGGWARTLGCACRLNFAAPQTAPLLLPVARHGDGALDIAFFADGSASGGALTLMQGERALRIEVDWLTGRSAVVE
jgi:general secretion pathway protein H